MTSGGLLKSGVVGVQCISAAPPSAGTAPVVALLYDCSGELLSIMGCDEISRSQRCHHRRSDRHRTKRSGAASGTMCVRNVTDIWAYSRDPERRLEFCSEASEELGIEVRPVDAPRDAVTGADIVLVSTNSPDPVFDQEWLKPGTYVGGMGRITELDPESSVGLTRLWWAALSSRAPGTTTHINLWFSAILCGLESSRLKNSASWETL